MIMKKVATILTVLFTACGTAFSQNGTWFCSEPGTVLSYVSSDASGAQTNSFQYIIKDVKKDGNATVISYDTVIPTVNAAPTGCTVRTEDGMFYTDASASMGQMGSNLQVSGNAPILPENPAVGQTLEDCSVSIASLATTVSYSKISFTRHEQITTPAGTFDAWCLEFTTNSKMAFVKAVNTNEQWFAKGVGVVRYVIKDKKGNVQSVQELVKIEKP